MKLAKFLKATKLPLVELLGDERIGMAQVRMDSEIGAQMVLDHFVKCGLRHFAYFTYGENWWTKMQSDAFRKAVIEKGAECHILQAADQPSYSARLARTLSAAFEQVAAFAASSHRHLRRRRPARGAIAGCLPGDQRRRARRNGDPRRRQRSDRLRNRSADALQLGPGRPARRL